MLKLIKDKFYIESKDLRKEGLRSPAGFSFQFGQEDVENNFWTTDIFAAFLFYKRNGNASTEVIDYFAEKLIKQKELYDLSYATTSDIKLLGPEGFEYRDYQKAGIEYCIKASNVLVADEMRMGKTSQSIGLINNIEVGKVLIVCPKTAKLVWVKELEVWLIKNKKIQVLTSNSEIDPEADIYICNYDILFILSGIAKIEFDLVIADEIHTCKNDKARRTMFFFAAQAKKKLGLTGTPLLNKASDLLTVLKWLDPFWENWRIYKEDFASSSGIRLTLDEVQDIIRSTVMLRRVQAQVFGTEPIEYRIVPLEVPKHLKAQIEIEKGGKKKVLQLNDYTKARKLIGLSKVNDAISHILSYTSDKEKIVIFAHHKEVIDRITASLGQHAVKIYGDTSDKERKEAIDRFNSDPECCAIVGSITAMGMAINLSVSSHILFVEFDWSSGMMEQAEERCSDKHQKMPVLVEYFVYENSLDEYMLDVQSKKELRSCNAIDVIY